MVEGPASSAGPEESVGVEVFTKKIDIVVDSAYRGQSMQGVKKCLNNKCLEYDQQLEGILLQYSDLKIIRKEDNILTENHRKILFRIKARFTVFRPVVGSQLSGVVTEETPTTLSCLVNRTFEVSVAKSGETSVSVNDTVTFTVKKIVYQGLVVFITGVLDGNSAQTVERQPSSSPQKRKVNGALDTEDSEDQSRAKKSKEDTSSNVKKDITNKKKRHDLPEGWERLQKISSVNPTNRWTVFHHVATGKTVKSIKLLEKYTEILKKSDLAEHQNSTVDQSPGSAENPAPSKYLKKMAKQVRKDWALCSDGGLVNEVTLNSFTNLENLKMSVSSTANDK